VRRRELLLAAGAVALARPAAAAAQVEVDRDVVGRTLRYEQASVFAYDHTVSSGFLGGAAGRLAERLRGHEAAHAVALAQRLTDLGGTPPRPPARVEHVEFPQLRAGLDALQDRESAIGLLVEVERLSRDVYRAAIAGMTDTRDIQLAATILAAEAGHLVAWRAVR